MIGYYYLHADGDLIFRSQRPDDDSSFVRAVWTINTANREDAWTVILEALSGGASLSRVGELVRRWRCDLPDFLELLRRITPTATLRDGANIFLDRFVNVDPHSFWEWLESCTGAPDLATLPRRSCRVAREETP